MPCRAEEGFAQVLVDPEADPPSTPPRHRVTDDGPSYAEESESESDSDAEEKSKKGKGKVFIEEFVPVTSWVLGEPAQLGYEDINRKIYEIMPDLIAPL